MHKHMLQSKSKADNKKLLLQHLLRLNKGLSIERTDFSAWTAKHIATLLGFGPVVWAKHCLKPHPPTRTTYLIYS